MEEAVLGVWHDGGEKVSPPAHPEIGGKLIKGETSTPNPEICQKWD